MANVIKVDVDALNLQLAQLAVEIGEYNYYIDALNTFTSPSPGAAPVSLQGAVGSSYDVLAGMESHYIKNYDLFLKQVRDPNTIETRKKLNELFFKASGAIKSLQNQDETYAGQLNQQ
jgi:hypothetical protein